MQKELTKLKVIDSSAQTQPLIAQLRAAETQCAEELSYVHVGSRFGAGFASGPDITAFIDYLATIESSKAMLDALQRQGSHQSSDGTRGTLFATNHEPTRQVREKSSTTRVQSTDDRSTSEGESTSDESEEEAPPLKPGKSKKVKRTNQVFLASEAESSSWAMGSHDQPYQDIRDNPNARAESSTATYRERSPRTRSHKSSDSSSWAMDSHNHPPKLSPCKFYNMPFGCRKGDRCPRLHKKISR